MRRTVMMFFSVLGMVLSLPGCGLVDLEQCNQDNPWFACQAMAGECDSRSTEFDGDGAAPSCDVDDLDYDNPAGKNGHSGVIPQCMEDDHATSGVVCDSQSRACQNFWRPECEDFCTPYHNGEYPEGSRKAKKAAEYCGELDE